MTSSNSQMHNDIMAAGSKERPLMLAPVQLLDTPSDDENLRQPGEIFKETYGNTTPKKQILIDAKAEEIKQFSSLGYNEKMMLCKQESKGIPLSVEQSKCLQDTNKEPDKQELEAHYMYMIMIQEVLHATDDNSGPTYDAEPFEKVDSNVILDSSNMCDNERTVDQNAEEHEDERVLIASLIANLKLDFDENKKIQQQLKKANMTLI
ncbi:hypothetical protein Tco_0717743 [Tanacetum coccineum]